MKEESMESSHELSAKPSIFSTLNPYKLKAFPYRQQTPGNITSWETDILELLKDVGAAAYYQIATERQYKKLDTLNRVGLLRKYQLINGEQINIIASHPYEDTTTILKSLVFTQLIINLRQNNQIKIYPGDAFVHSFIDLNDKIFPVIITRHGENYSLLPLLTKEFKRLIILAEDYHPEFNNIIVPTRIGIDSELLNGLIFRMPDGTYDTTFAVGL